MCTTRTVSALILSLCTTVACSSGGDTTEDDGSDETGTSLVIGPGTNSGTGGTDGATSTGVGGGSATNSGSASATASGGTGSANPGAGGTADSSTGGQDVGGVGGSPVGDGGTGANEESNGAIYYRVSCAECHGPSGEGVPGKGPDVMHPTEPYSAYVISNGRTAADAPAGVFDALYEEEMPAADTAILTAEIMTSLMAFLAEPAQPTTGEGLYNDYCAACHGDDGLGTITDRSLMGEADKVSRLVRDGHAGEFNERHDYMPSWTASEISDAELQLIETYVESLQ